MASGSSSSSVDNSASVNKPESASLVNLQLYLRRHKERMFEQRLLDDYYRRLEMLEVPENTGFVAETIREFYGDAEGIFMSLENLLDKERTNFALLNTYIYRLKGASASIGCPTIKRACIKFERFCEWCNKQGCIEALRQLKCEYYRMKENLDYILELNEKIKKAEEDDEDSDSDYE